jgi:E3 ubiquitin-protein ligase synoviolin
MGFFMILMAFYGIPIHIMRDLFMTIRSFIKRLNDFVKYRNATRDMNARYPDATAEELGRENTCIVCREEMRPWVPPTEAQAGRRVDERQRAKKLPCGHILHFSCLRSWLERQQVCPTCRRPVLEDANAQSGQNNPNGNGNGNQNQQNRQGQNNQGNMQPQAGQPGQQGQGPPQNRPGNAPGNIRVFNLGPIRIALGRLRVPAQQPGNANQAANNDNMIANFARQMAQDPDQLQQQNQLPTQGLPQPPTQGSTNVPATQILQPAEIQSEIFRLQQIIINSLRALNAQHDQLDHVHALLGELQRLQQASGSSTVGEQEHSVMPPVMPTGFAPMTPQAFFSNGTALRQGDPRLPEGLVLPEGWTLTPLAPNVPTGNTGGPSLSPPQPTPTTSGTAQPEQSASSSMSTTVLQPEPTQQHPPTSTGDAAPGPSGSADKSHESSSLGSSWSFDNTNTTAENSGSSSGVAQRGAEGQTVLRRGATVEDSEDSEQ